MNQNLPFGKNFLFLRKHVKLHVIISRYVLLSLIPYRDKMNLLPIETAEIRRNPELRQTAGW